MSVGDVIRYERIRQQITLEQMGEELFKVHTAICAWEKGRTKPSINDVPRICKLLSITPNHLFEWVEVEEKTNDEFLEDLEALIRRRRGK